MTKLDLEALSDLSSWDALTPDMVEQVQEAVQEIRRLRKGLGMIVDDCPGLATEWHDGTKPCPSCAPRSFANGVLMGMFPGD